MRAIPRRKFERSTSCFYKDICLQILPLPGTESRLLYSSGGQPNVLRKHCTNRVNMILHMKRRKHVTNVVPSLLKSVPGGGGSTSESESPQIPPLFPRLIAGNSKNKNINPGLSRTQRPFSCERPCCSQSTIPLNHRTIQRSILKIFGSMSGRKVQYLVRCPRLLSPYFIPENSPSESSRYEVC